MPVFQVLQRVSHPKSDIKREKVVEIIGYDLRHAISMIRCTEFQKKELAKKYWSRTTDIQGRTLYIEIIADGARSKRGGR